jgi:hypothetical protein
MFLTVANKTEFEEPAQALIEMGSIETQPSSAPGSSITKPQEPKSPTILEGFLFLIIRQSTTVNPALQRTDSKLRSSIFPMVSYGKTRWFSSQENKLCYYKKKNDKDPMGVIVLDAATEIILASKTNPNDPETIFEVRAAGKKFSFHVTQFSL